MIWYGLDKSSVFLPSLPFWSALQGLRSAKDELNGPNERHFDVPVTVARVINQFL